MTFRTSLMSREVLPFLLWLLVLIGAAVAIDAVLHFADLVWIGRYLGIVGTVLILASSGYSLAKHKWIARGNMLKRLRRHERLAWAGALLVLVHAGVHFNAVLAWLAVAAMMINVASGLTGKFLLARARRRMEQTRADLLAQGMVASNVDDRMHMDSLTYGVIKQWRSVHVPITLAFAVLALAHIISIFLFWGWK